MEYAQDICSLVLEPPQARELPRRAPAAAEDPAARARSLFKTRSKLSRNSSWPRWNIRRSNTGGYGRVHEKKIKPTSNPGQALGKDMKTAATHRRYSQETHQSIERTGLRPCHQRHEAMTEPEDSRSPPRISRWLVATMGAHRSARPSPSPKTARRRPCPRARQPIHKTPQAATSTSPTHRSRPDAPPEVCEP